MHECEFCGDYCDCDGEDLDQPQPVDCAHFSEDCGESLDEEGEYA